MQVIDASLRRDFGFKHILWVYSGRRGVHCWVCDERARKLNDEQRGAVANYLAIYKGQEKGVPKLALHHKMLNHSFVEGAYDVLLQHWNKVSLARQLLSSASPMCCKFCDKHLHRTALKCSIHSDLLACALIMLRWMSASCHVLLTADSDRSGSAHNRAHT
jgi:hypothetical protein